MAQPRNAVEYTDDPDRRRWAVWLGGAAMAAIAIWWVTDSPDAVETERTAPAARAEAALSYSLEHTSWRRAASDDGQDDVEVAPAPPPPAGAMELAERYQNADVIMGGSR